MKSLFSPSPLSLRLCVAGLVAALAVTTSAGETDWWTEDVWSDPDRPFLYYGLQKDLRPNIPAAKPDAPNAPVSEKSAPRPTDPNDFSAFKTLPALKAERERRLEEAVMDPTPANMQAYQAINAHVLSLSARFASAWQIGRLTHPEYDWTAAHPSANFATAALAEKKREAQDALLKGLASDAGLLFIGRPGDALTTAAAPPVAAFARTYGIEVLAVAAGTAFSGRVPGERFEGFAAFETVQADGGRAEALGIGILPAVLLIPNPKATARRADFSRLKGALRGRDGFLLAAGAVSGEELGRRIAAVLAPEPETSHAVTNGAPAALPTSVLPSNSFK